jgi:hypothetical protein
MCRREKILREEGELVQSAEEKDEEASRGENRRLKLVSKKEKSLK